MRWPAFNGSNIYVIFKIFLPQNMGLEGGPSTFNLKVVGSMHQRILLLKKIMYTRESNGEGKHDEETS